MLDQIIGQLPAVRSFQSEVARLLYLIKIRANQASILGAILGVAAGVLFASGWVGFGIFALVLSGALDAIDGTIARTYGGATPWGGVLDLTLDRVVEAAVLLGLVCAHPRLAFPAAVVIATWYVNITVFMATGAALEATEKFIHYPPGLVERTEGFIFFILLAIVPTWAVSLCYLYAALEVATALQRLSYATRYLSVRKG